MAGINGTWRATKPIITDNSNGRTSTVQTIVIADKKITYQGQCTATHNDGTAQTHSKPVSVTVGLKVDTQAGTITPQGNKTKTITYGRNDTCFAEVNTTPSAYRLSGANKLVITDQGAAPVTYQRVK